LQKVLKVENVAHGQSTSTWPRATFQ